MASLVQDVTDCSGFFYPLNYAKMKTMISFDDFAKLDIKIGTIIKAEPVEGTDKLLKLKIDLGEGQRELVAGIAETYKPEDIKGKQIPILTNLEPKTIKGIESQGMILAVEVNGKAVLMNPDKNVPDGSKIR